MLPRRCPCLAVLLLLLLLLAEAVCPLLARAQTSERPPGATPDTARSHAPSNVSGRRVPALDQRVLRAVYRADGPVATAAMRVTDAAAYPVFYGAPAVAWGTALLRGTGYAAAYRLTLAEGLALGTALGLKKVFGRPRPYLTMPEVRSRSERYRRGSEGRFAEAFPSGHAATAFALATSWSLSHPAWYVAGPAFAGATLIGASRLWLGVHYPSDVLAGALLGTAAAVGVHLLRDALTPAVLEGEAAHSSVEAPMLSLRLPLP